MKINKCNSPSKQAERKKPNDHHITCKKKVFDKIQHSLMIKVMARLTYEGHIFI